MLPRCAQAWAAALPEGSPVFVTVDGDMTAVNRVLGVLAPVWFDSLTVVQVGQPTERSATELRSGRSGVAVCKNTGLEALSRAGVEDLFLSDDDTWPLSDHALELHTEFQFAHSMVCWGRSRIEVGAESNGYASWGWPRGVVLHVTRAVLDRVGGMSEDFGPGGHEHAEWSKRIRNSGITPVDFPTPIEYARDKAMGALRFWHAEDARRAGEALGSLGHRRKLLTSVRRVEGDWTRIEKVLARLEGSTDFISYYAADNHRDSAIVFTKPLSLGALD